MKLIDFGKIGEHFEKTLRPGRRMRSPRTTIVLTVLHAIFTGFCLGWAVFGYVRGHDFFAFLIPLTLSLSFAGQTLRGTVIALRNCPRPTNTVEPELRSARA